MVTKPFRELTTEEATEVAKKCVNSSHSEEQIRTKLTEAGFDGKGAAVTSMSHGDMFMAMIMVWGPNGEIISA